MSSMAIFDGDPRASSTHKEEPSIILKVASSPDSYRHSVFAQKTLNTNNVASSRKFPPQNAVTRCMIAR
jgi:hypothetical protein